MVRIMGTTDNFNDMATDRTIVKMYDIVGRTTVLVCGTVFATEFGMLAYGFQSSTLGWTIYWVNLTAVIWHKLK